MPDTDESVRLPPNSAEETQCPPSDGSGIRVFREALPLRFGDKPGTMVVRIYEPRESHGTVFCIHGFDANGAYFDYLARRLVRDGFKVIAPDIVGRGKSTYFRDPSMYTIETHIRCIQALSRYAGKINDFIGSSWGGAILMYFLYFARVLPNKLILNDACLRYSQAVEDAKEFLVNDSKMAFDTLDEAHAYVRRTRGYLGKFPDDLWGTYLANKIIAQDGKYRLAYDPAITANLRVPTDRSYDLFPLLERTTTRTLLLYGSESPFYDERRIADLMNLRPNISCIPKLDGGHPPSLMTDEQARLVLEFLRSA